MIKGIIAIYYSIGHFLLLFTLAYHEDYFALRRSKEEAGKLDRFQDFHVISPKWIHNRDDTPPSLPVTLRHIFISLGNK